MWPDRWRVRDVIAYLVVVIIMMAVMGWLAALAIWELEQLAARGATVRFAYADPPYVGQSRKHYGGAEVNHQLLLAYLVSEFTEGWALSCSSPSLRVLLPLCPEDVRVGAWVKPFAAFKVHVNPAYCWEPVIFRGGRTRPREVPTVRDFVSVPITLERGVVGAKPQGFCYWIFDLLGARPGDEFVDLFPGSGALGEAWRRYAERLEFSV